MWKQRFACPSGPACGELALVESVAASASRREGRRRATRLAPAGAGRLGRVGQRPSNQGGTGSAAFGREPRKSVWLGRVATADRKTLGPGIHIASPRPAEERDRRLDVGVAILSKRRGRKKSCVPFSSPSPFLPDCGRACTLIKRSSRVRETLWGAPSQPIRAHFGRG
jgi:hypothetical protein